MRILDKRSGSYLIENTVTILMLLLAKIQLILRIMFYILIMAVAWLIVVSNVISNAYIYYHCYFRIIDIHEKL